MFEVVSNVFHQESLSIKETTTFADGKSRSGRKPCIWKLETMFVKNGETNILFF